MKLYVLRRPLINVGKGNQSSSQEEVGLAALIFALSALALFSLIIRPLEGPVRDRLVVFTRLVISIAALMAMLLMILALREGPTKKGVMQIGV